MVRYSIPRNGSPTIFVSPKTPFQNFGSLLSQFQHCAP
jgi:hypothetical protein